jgi:ribulose-phosphate 3-epimerase
MKIIPAILTNDIGQLTTLEKEAENAVDRIQIDVIDNKFADNSTVDPAVLKNISTNLSLDFHLMVKGPIDWIEHCVESKNNRIIGQIEQMENQHTFIDKVKNAGSMAGLGVDLPTPLINLDKSVLSKIDILLIMSVKAGFDHQEFDLTVFDKIKEAVELRRKIDANFKISVDGGVTKLLINQMESLGVDEVFVGKRIFEGNLKENLKLFMV